MSPHLSLGLGLTTFLLALPPASVAEPIPRILQQSSPSAKRSITTDTSQLDGKTFDYVIAGGGQAGLVVAARLAEDPNVSVAVLEAGTGGSPYMDSVLVPGFAYLNSTSHTAADWAYTTVNQSYAPGPSLQKYWPRGKLLGGSSATNGLFYNSAGQQDYDAWDSLNGGNSNWSWSTMAASMEKAENFTAPTSDQISTFQIPFNSSSHGLSGPIHTSFSSYIYPDNSRWIPGMNELGVPSNDVAAGGLGRGVGFSTSCIDPTNETRSYSKTGYIDPYVRDNLVILTGARVTEINWSSTKANATASGVEFASETAGSDATTYSVNASKEVIISGGSINTPQILQLSGVGPSSLLSGLGIDVVVDLPGVGYNLQDHVSSGVYFATTSANDTWNDLSENTTLSADQLSLFWSDPSQSQWSYVNEAIAFLSGSDLLGDDLQSFISSLDADAIIANNTAHNPGVDDTVIAGWKAQHNQTSQFLGSDVGDMQILFSTLGGGPGMVAVQLSYMHPFARGSVLINSTSPFAKPAINPNYLDNAADVALCRAAVQFIRRLPNTTAWAGWVTGETAPGAAVVSDADIDAYVGESSGTSYHPVGTAAMLPLSLGGVVDTTLKVYGTTNVRVIDASVIPLQVAANTQRTVYGIAEKGAELLQAAAANASSSSAGGGGASKSGAGSVRVGSAALVLGAAAVFLASGL